MDTFIDFVCPKTVAITVVMFLIFIFLFLIVTLQREIIDLVKKNNPDIYEKLIGGFKDNYETDVYGYNSLFIYSEFKKAIGSAEFPELKQYAKTKNLCFNYTIVCYLLSFAFLVILAADCRLAGS